MDDSGDVLQQLAKAAGVSSQWRDHRGDMRDVSPDVLKAVLAELELPAESPAQCKESLERLHRSNERDVPSMTTGRTGEHKRLPAGLQGRLQSGETVQLLDDSGAPTSVQVTQGQDGELYLPLNVTPGYYTLEAGELSAQFAIAPSHCTQASELTGRQRNYGLAAQIYSLPRQGDGGIGDFTALAQLADSCGRSGADALAISPVHALFSADVNRYSPYAPSSRLFLNALYIDPAAVLGHELVASCINETGIQEQLQALEKQPLIDWPEAAKVKLALLRCLWKNRGGALMAGEGPLGQDYQQFLTSSGQALQQHGVFEALHQQQYGNDWQRWHWRSWPEEFQNPGNPAVQQFANEHRDEIGFHCFLQWLAARGLEGAQNAGRQAGMGIGLIADLAIGTDSGGSHAWSRQREMLNGMSVGAPPDLINHQGQNWGLTTFSPRALQAHNYLPFLEMLRASLRYSGGLRIDHVLGLRRLWLIPEGAEATHGAYLSFPQEDLLNLIALESWRHNAIIVGEDLGTVPEGFRDQISDVGLLGMQVLWFEQEHGLYMDPSRWRTNAMATTTTHDLPTVSGWWRGRDIDWNEKLDRLAEGRTVADEQRDREQERKALWAAFQHSGVADGNKPPASEPESAVDSAFAFVANTPSPLALVPVEDILGLEEQPNLPGTIDEHPNWKRRLPLAATEVLEGDRSKYRMSLLRHRATAPPHTE